jgi:hypothetical protein
MSLDTLFAARAAIMNTLYMKEAGICWLNAVVKVDANLFFNESKEGT